MLRSFQPSVWLVPFLLVVVTTLSHAGEDVGPFVRAVWLVQRHGNLEIVRAEHDQKLKGKLSKALGKQGILTAAGAQGLMDTSTFAKLAGDDGQLDSKEIQKCLEADVPESRKSTQPQRRRARRNADDLVRHDRRDSTGKPVRSSSEWIVKNYKPGQPLHVTVICTGNSRRSIFGATMGNIAAAYYGMPEIRFHSGGTAPTAFNPRTIAALKDIGVEIEPTGQEAPRGEPKTANPTYVVRWGDGHGGDRVLQDLLRRQQSTAGIRRPHGLWRSRRCLPAGQGSRRPHLDALPGPQDLRRQPIRGPEVRRAAGRHRPAHALRDDASAEPSEPSSPLDPNRRTIMSETITQAVKNKYGSVATSGLSSDHEGVKAVAEAFGYTPEELASIPAEANMGLSCGNPTAFANCGRGEWSWTWAAAADWTCCSRHARSVPQARRSGST